MKILITGCQGFIGSNLVTHLQSQGHTVIGMDKRKSSRREVSCELIVHDIETPIPIENDFDRVYHMAADNANSKTQSTKFLHPPPINLGCENLHKKRGRGSAPFFWKFCVKVVYAPSRPIIATDETFWWGWPPRLWVMPNVGSTN